jgi:hypothetical protein
VRKEHYHVLQKNIVGLFNNDQSNSIIHLFLTPHLSNGTFSVHPILKDQGKKTEDFNRKNIFSNTHIIEGNKIVQNNANVNKDLLNQDHCICEHPDTERYFSPNKKTFKNLASSANQKNFLLENLGKYSSCTCFFFFPNYLTSFQNLVDYLQNF